MKIICCGLRIRGFWCNFGEFHSENIQNFAQKMNHTNNNLSSSTRNTSQGLSLRDVVNVLVGSMGQFLGQGLATLVGIIIPLMDMISGESMSSGMQGIVGCMSLTGIMIGSVLIGRLTDRYGYGLFFRLCPAVCGLSALIVVLFPKTGVLLPSLFVMGLAVGGEYGFDAEYVSEKMPQKWKLFMVGVAKALASAGSAFVAFLCFMILKSGVNPSIWGNLLWIVVGICGMTFLARITVAKAPANKIQQGEQIPSEQESFWTFVSGNMREVILTGFPWACEGLGVYGIGVFLPILIMALGVDSALNQGTGILKVANSVELTFILSLVMMVGFGLGLYLLRKVNHIFLQVAGFVMSGVGLVLLLLAYENGWNPWFSICGLVVFELALNAGPHLVAFMLPSEVYIESSKGTGSGIAASLGKSGAVLGTFLVPIILRNFRVEGLLWTTIVVMMAGAAVTYFFGRKTLK